jgi:ribose 5-phosphate isomerase B
VLFCWTGTGASIAANKVPGVRAALCTDAATAAGSRTWNDANVVVMGLRLTSPELAREMLDAWFSTEPDPQEAANIAGLEPAPPANPGPAPAREPR